MSEALLSWLRRLLPTHEQLAANRLSRPFTRRPELFRFTRRSVPRGVAIGLLVGIFAMLPGVQAVSAALICVPCRGNVPIAIASTLVSNPATALPIILAALYVGGSLGANADFSSFLAMYQTGASVKEWLIWASSDAASAIILGLFVLAVVTSALGYLITAMIWRIMVARKLRLRQKIRKANNPAK